MLPFSVKYDMILGWGGIDSYIYWQYPNVKVQPLSSNTVKSVTFKTIRIKYATTDPIFNFPNLTDIYVIDPSFSTHMYWDNILPEELRSQVTLHLYNASEDVLDVFRKNYGDYYKSIVAYKDNYTLNVAVEGEGASVALTSNGTEVQVEGEGARSVSVKRGDAAELHILYNKETNSATLKRNGEEVTLTETADGASYSEENIDEDVNYQLIVEPKTCTINITTNTNYGGWIDYLRANQNMQAYAGPGSIRPQCGSTLTLNLPYDVQRPLAGVTLNGNAITIPSPVDSRYIININVPNQDNATLYIDWNTSLDQEDNPTIKVVRSGDGVVKMTAWWERDQDGDFRNNKVVNCDDAVTHVTVPFVNNSEDEALEADWWKFQVEITPANGHVLRNFLLGFAGTPGDESVKKSVITWYDMTEEDISKRLSHDASTGTYKFVLDLREDFLDFGVGDYSIIVSMGEEITASTVGNKQTIIRRGGTAGVCMSYDDNGEREVSVGEGTTVVTIPNSDSSVEAYMIIDKVAGEKFTAYRDGIDVTSQFIGESQYEYDFDADSRYTNPRQGSVWTLLFEKDEVTRTTADWIVCRTGQKGEVSIEESHNISTDEGGNTVGQVKITDIEGDVQTVSIERTNLERVCLTLKREANGLSPKFLCSGGQSFEVKSNENYFYVEVSADELTDATWQVGYELAADLIEFADAEVKRICVENWDTNGDGELSYQEAAAVTTLLKDGTSVFRGNKTITSFDELQYFSGLTSIEDHAFRSCSELTSIVVPGNVKKIQQYGFGYCYKLTNLTLQEGLEEIGLLAFLECSALETIKLPKSLTTLGTQPFNACTKLRQFYLPENVSKISYLQFPNCSNLVSIVVDANNPYYDSRNNCNAIIRTNDNTLVSACPTTIVPDGIECLGDNCFQTVKVERVELPATVKKSSHWGFYLCPMKELVMHHTDPFQFNAESMFRSADYYPANCKLIVPVGSIDAYKAKGWLTKAEGGAFTEIVEDVSQYDVNSDGKVTIADVTKLVNVILGKE